MKFFAMKSTRHARAGSLPRLGAACLGAVLLASVGSNCRAFDRLSYRLLTTASDAAPANDVAGDARSDARADDVGVDAGPTRSDFITVRAGGSHTCAIRTGGSVVCWGGTDRGQTGVVSNTPVARPMTPVPGLSDVIELAAG